MDHLASFACCFLVVFGLEVCGNPQRDHFRPSLPPPPPLPRPTTTITTSAPILQQQQTIQVLNIPIGPALQLAGGIVGGVIAATRPTVSPTADLEFSCAGRVPGYYADITTNCKNFYTCSPRGRRQYHRCGERTIFNQYYLTCDHRRNYDCRRALQDYSINEQRQPFTKKRPHIN